MKFLSFEEHNVVVGLDLYCYDKDFNTRWKTEKADSIVNNIYKQYQNFLSDCKCIDDIFMKEFNEEREEWDIQTKIESKEDLYSKIQVIQVDIVKESYIINFILDDERWSLVKICYEGKTSYFCINPTEETEFAEMDYH